MMSHMNLCSAAIRSAMRCSISASVGGTMSSLRSRGSGSSRSALIRRQVFAKTLSLYPLAQSPRWVCLIHVKRLILPPNLEKFYEFRSILADRPSPKEGAAEGAPGPDGSLERVGGSGPLRK